MSLLLTTALSSENRKIRYIDSHAVLPQWKFSGDELRVDCTGRVIVRSGAQARLVRGAQRVLVSDPSKTLEECNTGLHLTNTSGPFVGTGILRSSLGLSYFLFEIRPDDDWTLFIDRRSTARSLVTYPRSWRIGHTG